MVLDFFKKVQSCFNSDLSSTISKESYELTVVNYDNLYNGASLTYESDFSKERVL